MTIVIVLPYHKNGYTTNTSKATDTFSTQHQNHLLSPVVLEYSLLVRIPAKTVSGCLQSDISFHNASSDGALPPIWYLSARAIYT
jgi:hypothetical protein